MGTSAGQIIEDADFTAINLAGDDKPFGRILGAAAQSIAHNSYVPLQFGTEEQDSHGFHSTSVNNSRVTPTVPGWYRVHAGFPPGGRTDYTFIEVTIRPNGGTPIAPSTRDRPPLTDAATTMCIYTSAMVECDGVTDYFEAVARHLNGAAAAQATAFSSHLNHVLEWEYVRGR